MSFGEGGALPSGDGGWAESFRRWDTFHPDRNLEITVSPHGYAGILLNEITARAKRRRLLGPQTLEPQRSEERILCVDPWNQWCEDKPKGYLGSDNGRTLYAATRWSIEIKGAREIRSSIDISFVNWCFYESGSDCTTSIVAKIVPRLSASGADVAVVAGRIRPLMQDLEGWLRNAPLRDLQVILRREMTRRFLSQSSTPPGSASGAERK